MKEPATRLDVWTVILKVVSDSMVALPGRGKVMMDETMEVFAGMSPMAIMVRGVYMTRWDCLLIPLHDPVTI